jgi:hypothetical protein
MPELPGGRLQVRLPAGCRGDQRPARADALHVREPLRLRGLGGGLPLPHELIDVRLGVLLRWPAGPWGHKA